MWSFRNHSQLIVQLEPWALSTDGFLLLVSPLQLQVVLSPMHLSLFFSLFRFFSLIEYRELGFTFLLCLRRLELVFVALNSLSFIFQKNGLEIKVAGYQGVSQNSWGRKGLLQIISNRLLKQGHQELISLSIMDISFWKTYQLFIGVLTGEGISL